MLKKTIFTPNGPKKLPNTPKNQFYAPPESNRFLFTLQQGIFGKVPYSDDKCVASWIFGLLEHWRQLACKS